MEQLREQDQSLVVGLSRRRRREVWRYIERAKGPWLECPGVGETRVQEVEAGEAGVRVFVAESEERLNDEKSRREKALEGKYLIQVEGCDLSSREAWQVLRTVRVVEIDVGQPKPQRSVTRGSGRAARILKALEIGNVHPNPETTVAAETA